MCKLWLVVDYLVCTASVFNIVLISYDRFICVTKAVRAGQAVLRVVCRGSKAAVLCRVICLRHLALNSIASHRRQVDVGNFPRSCKQLWEQ